MSEGQPIQKIHEYNRVFFELDSIIQSLDEAIAVSNDRITSFRNSLKIINRSEMKTEQKANVFANNHNQETSASATTPVPEAKEINFVLERARSLRGGKLSKKDVTSKSKNHTTIEKPNRLMIMKDEKEMKDIVSSSKQTGAEMPSEVASKESETTDKDEIQSQDVSQIVFQALFEHLKSAHEYSNDLTQKTNLLQAKLSLLSRLDDHYPFADSSLYNAIEKEYDLKPYSNSSNFQKWNRVLGSEISNYSKNLRIKLDRLNFSSIEAPDRMNTFKAWFKIRKLAAMSKHRVSHERNAHNTNPTTNNDVKIFNLPLLNKSLANSMDVDSSDILVQYRHSYARSLQHKSECTIARQLLKLNISQLKDCCKTHQSTHPVQDNSDWVQGLSDLRHIYSTLINQAAHYQGCHIIEK